MARRKTPPDNLERCCIGRCSQWSIIIYYKVYGLCEKHWNAYCDGKFKHKHYRDMREYLGLPPIKKPKGWEDVPNTVCDDELAFHHQVEIDVEHNLPVLVYEEYALWPPPSANIEQAGNTNTSCLDYCVKWSGVKKEPLDLFISINNKNISLLRGTGTGVRFTSEGNIESAIVKVQDVLNESNNVLGLESRISKKFKNSKMWNSVECEAILRKAINGTV